MGSLPFRFKCLTLRGVNSTLHLLRRVVSIPPNLLVEWGKTKDFGVLDDDQRSFQQDRQNMLAPLNGWVRLVDNKILQRDIKPKLEEENCFWTALISWPQTLKSLRTISPVSYFQWPNADSIDTYFCHASYYQGQPKILLFQELKWMMVETENTPISLSGIEAIFAHLKHNTHIH